MKSSELLYEQPVRRMGPSVVWAPIILVYETAQTYNMCDNILRKASYYRYLHFYIFTFPYKLQIVVEI